MCTLVTQLPRCVADGTDAGLAWELPIKGGLDSIERDMIKKARLEYCGQDTLALTKLLGCLLRKTSSE
jgi:hypothetical protein